VSSLISRKPTPLTGAAEGSLVRLLRSCAYQGTVARLARLIGYSDHWTLRALARLHTSGMAKISGDLGGVIALSITAAGRRPRGGVYRLP
jgi:hypothetical protein